MTENIIDSGITSCHIPETDHIRIFLIFFLNCMFIISHYR